MHSYSPKSRKSTVLSILKWLRKTRRFFMLGLSSRQWVTCFVICCIFSLLVTLPSGVTVVRSATLETSDVEPVNKELPFFSGLWRKITADLETRTVSWRPANLFAPNGDDKDKTKGKKLSPGKNVAVSKIVEPVAKNHDTAPTVIEREISTKKETTSIERIVSARPAAVMEVQLPPAESQSVYAYENNLGSPKGQVEMDSPNRPAAMDIQHRVGIANFSFNLPLASIHGRGIDAGVDLFYNSRTWNKSCSGSYTGTPPVCSQDHFTYDVDKSWIAPGFSSGFGSITSKMQSNGYYPSNGPAGSINEVIPEGIIEPDGTRHEIACTATALADIPGWGPGSAGYHWYCTAFRTTDGSEIKVVRNGAPYGLNGYTLNHSNISFTALYPNGSQSEFSHPFEITGGLRTHYPESINDRNGNVINIAYRSEHTGAIDYINDTLNRRIKFYYDTSNNLLAITVPGKETNQEIQTVRFYYENRTLYTGGFSATSQVTMPTGPIKVLKYVYLPATKTGYKYEYNDYFGMIKQITRFVGMAVSTTATSDMGSITDGLSAATTVYTYPTATGISDVPTYTSRIDNWQGNTGDPQVTDYNVQEPNQNNNYRYISTITTHQGSTDVIYTTKSLANGMLEETSTTSIEVANLIQWPLTKTEYTWFPDTRNLQRIDVTNDSGLTKSTRFEYDSYGNQTEAMECGYETTPVNCSTTTALRRTVIAYAGTPWTTRNLVRLPLSITKYVVGSTAPASKSVYQYDDYTGTNVWADAPNAPQHLESYNALNPAMQPPVCYCSALSGAVADVHCPSGTVWTCDEPEPVYNPMFNYRGNLTKVISFPDASSADNDPDNDVITMRYDITGNVVEEKGLSCCSIKTWTYDAANGYAYPTTQTRGSSDIQLSTHATYNRNTGLMISSSDENDQTTSYEYENETFRLKKTIHADGGYVETAYSDTFGLGTNDLLPAFTRQTTKLDSSRTVQSYSYFDARGLGIRSATETSSDGWSISAMIYDTLGRPFRTYNQFYGATPTATIPSNAKYTEVSLDPLGRTTNVKLQDNTTVSTYFSTPGDITSGFNKTFVTVIDQAGKKRRQVMDALGRIVRVDEPILATGQLPAVNATPPSGQHTTYEQTAYEYDGNDNLINVWQSDGTIEQNRIFKYDALSRLTHEKEVEATATLNNNGQKVTTGGLWTKVLKYDPHGLLTDGYDARGVHTQFTYDGLNRVSHVEYHGETGYQTPPVFYTYDQDRSGSYNKGALTKVETETAAGGDVLMTKTEFDYDVMGRVAKHRQWIGGQQYNLEYGYNLAGQLTSETYPDGRVVANAYDTKGRLSAIADGSRTYLSGLQYQGKGGSISSMNFGNGTSEAFSLNDRYQMVSQTFSKSSNVLQKYDYGYGQIDGSGNLDTTKNNGQLGRIEGYIGTIKQWTQKFQYDRIGRLKQAEERRGDYGALTYKQVFDFDRFGNMYRKVASNPTTGQENPLPYTAIEDSNIDKSTNRLMPQTGLHGIVYDEAGNVIIDKKFRGLNLTYDANGRTVRSTATIAQEPPIIDLSVYDAAGMRVAERINDVWRFLIYDIGGKLIAEYGGPAAMDSGGVKYMMSDWQGSTRAVTNITGQVKGRSDYTVYGESIGAGIGFRTSAQGFGSAVVPRQKYGLTERDSSTGLDHTPWRKYENRAGRWTSPDPYRKSMSIGDPQSFNRYSYVSSQPTNYIDPSGLLRIQQCTRYWWTNPDGTRSYSSWFCVVIYDDGGGSMGGGSGGAGASSTLFQNDCVDFVNQLAARVEAHINDTTAKINIGAEFLKEAVNLLGAGKTAVTGFIGALVAGGQENDVYRHIYGAAGSYLLDGVGAGELADSVRQDLANWWDGGARSAEREAAKADNSAGTSAGSLISSRIRGDLTAEKLVEKLKNLLCSK